MTETATQAKPDTGWRAIQGEAEWGDNSFEFWDIVDGDGLTIASLTRSDSRDGARARLIAAAPDLLAACEAMVDEVELRGDCPICLMAGHVHMCPVGMAAAAIAKTKEESR